MKRNLRIIAIISFVMASISINCYAQTISTDQLVGFWVLDEDKNPSVNFNNPYSQASIGYHFRENHTVTTYLIWETLSFKQKLAGNFSFKDWSKEGPWKIENGKLTLFKGATREYDGTYLIRNTKGKKLYYKKIPSDHKLAECPKLFSEFIFDNSQDWERDQDISSGSTFYRKENTTITIKTVFLSLEGFNSYEEKIKKSIEYLKKELFKYEYDTIEEKESNMFGTIVPEIYTQRKDNTDLSKIIYEQHLLINDSAFSAAHISLKTIGDQNEFIHNDKYFKSNLNISWRNCYN